MPGLGKTNHWFSSLSEKDQSRFREFAQSGLFRIRKETREFVSLDSAEEREARFDRLQLGKIQSDIRKFLAFSAFVDGIQQSNFLNLLQLRGMRSRIQKPGKNAETGFRWEDYLTEVANLRNKTSREGDLQTLFSLESEHQAFISENEKRTEEDARFSAKSGDALDIWYVTERMKAFCVKYANQSKQQKPIPEEVSPEAVAEEPQLQQSELLINLSKTPHISQNLSVQFFRILLQYYSALNYNKEPDPETVSKLAAIYYHEAFIPDKMASAFLYSYYTSQINQGIFHHNQPFLRILTTGIQNKTLRDTSGRIPQPYYRTFTIMSILTGNDANLPKLLLNWKDELAGNKIRKEAMYRHCLAIYYLAKKKYTRAWQFSEGVKFKYDVYLWLHAELRFKIQFEARMTKKALEHGKEWVDTQEEELEIMDKLILQTKKNKSSQLARNAAASKLAIYKWIETNDIDAVGNRDKAKQMVQNSKLPEIDLNWFANILKIKAGELRPLHQNS